MKIAASEMTMNTFTSAITQSQLGVNVNPIKADIQEKCIKFYMFMVIRTQLVYVRVASCVGICDCVFVCVCNEVRLVCLWLCSGVGVV